MHTNNSGQSIQSAYSAFAVRPEEMNFSEELGQGNFGVVHKATWRHNLVAVKKMFVKNLSEKAKKEFENEIAVMAKMRSPNIVTFYGYYMSPDYAIVMEYMAKGSLYHVLHGSEELGWGVRKQIALDIVRGLAFLHQEGIVHRDLKSLNVLLDDNSKAKLSDFGLASIKSESNSFSSAASRSGNNAVGTLAWMAPELFKRKPIFTTASDIYSYGMVLWELAARQIPFSDVSNRELIPSFVKEGEREEIPEDTPSEISNLITTCWSAQIEQRPTTDQVIEQLNNLIISLSPPPLMTTMNTLAKVPVQASLPAFVPVDPPKLVSPPISLEDKLQSLCEKQISLDSLQDDPALYIPPSGSYTQFSKQVFDLTGTIEAFLESEKHVLLLLGESGAGKSFFGQTLVRDIAQKYHEGGMIPLFVSLPILRNPTKQLMSEALAQYGFSTEEVGILREKRKFVLFLDAYDELATLENLYVTNNLEKWQVKILISCRPSYLTKLNNYKRYFIPYKGEKRLLNAFEELYVAPFVAQQIELYIKQYLRVKTLALEKDILLQSKFTKEWLNCNIYLEWIEKIPGLKLLVQTPFLLKIVMEVLPEIVSDYQSIQSSKEHFKITRVKLYDAFINQWFVRQEDRLFGLGEDVSRSFQKDCMTFAKALAKKMHEKNLKQVHYEDKGILDMGEDGFEEENEWDIFFSDEMLPQDKGKVERQKARICARKACPLRKVGPNDYAFLHTSILEHLVALNLIGPNYTRNDTEQNVPQENITINTSSYSSSGLRILGEYTLLNKIDRKEADRLFREEGLHIVFNENEVEKSVVLGQGKFGKFRLARHSINQRFVGVKKIHGLAMIEASKQEFELQIQLNGLANIMPIWYSTEQKNRHNQPVLYQFMPLAGFGNGGLLKEMLLHVEDSFLKKRFLLYLAKNLLIGMKEMHSRRIYHLDIKPDNFVLDSRGILYLIDFGCAMRKYDNSPSALLEGGSGDIYYYPPERIAVRRYNSKRLSKIAEMQDKVAKFDGIKADSWSLGITLLELLEGVYPLESVPVNEILEVWNAKYFNDIAFRQCSSFQDDSNDMLISMIKQLLVVDAEKRLTPKKALSLPIFSAFEWKISDEEIKQLMDKFIERKAKNRMNIEQKKEQSTLNVSNVSPLPTVKNKESYENQLKKNVERLVYEGNETIQMSTSSPSVVCFETNLQGVQSTEKDSSFRCENEVVEAAQASASLPAIIYPEPNSNRQDVQSNVTLSQTPLTFFQKPTPQNTADQVPSSIEKPVQQQQPSQKSTSQGRSPLSWFRSQKGEGGNKSKKASKTFKQGF